MILHCFMSDWSTLPEEITGAVFGFLKIWCGCGKSDKNVKFVCKKWNVCKVVCFNLKLCVNYKEEEKFNGMIFHRVKSVDIRSNKGKGMSEGIFDKLLGVDEINIMGISKKHYISNGLMRCKSLRKLYLTNVENAYTCNWNVFVNLEELKLINCKYVTNFMLSALGTLNKLRKLSVRRSGKFNDVRASPGWWDGMGWLRDMKRLIVLDVLDCIGVDDNGMKIVGELVDLEEFSVEGIEITDVGVRMLSGVKKLRKLSLVGTSISDEGMEVLREFDGLCCLNLGRCKGITDDGVKKLGCLRNLEELDLNNTEVTDVGFLLGEGEGGFWRIKKLDLSNCSGIVGYGLAGLKELETLDLSWCENVVWERIYNRLSKLRDLSLCGCNGDYEMLMCLPIGLNVLDLGCMNDFSGVHLSMKHLERLKNVRNLNLMGCEINGDALKQLGELNNLEVLVINTNMNNLFDMSKLLNLRDLTIFNNNINDRLLNELSKLIFLEKLWLSQQFYITEEYIRRKLCDLMYLCDVIIQ